MHPTTRQINTHAPSSSFLPSSGRISIISIIVRARHHKSFQVRVDRFREAPWRTIPGFISRTRVLLYVLHKLDPDRLLQVDDTFRRRVRARNKIRVPPRESHPGIYPVLRSVLWPLTWTNTVRAFVRRSLLVSFREKRRFPNGGKIRRQDDISPRLASAECNWFSIRR